MKKTEWTPIRIPTPLFNEITDIINNKPERGYTNEHEFVRAALRDKINKINEDCKEKEEG